MIDITMSFVMPTLRASVQAAEASQTLQLSNNHCTIIAGL
jgi:hypothetical protein